MWRGGVWLLAAVACGTPPRAQPDASSDGAPTVIPDGPRAPGYAEWKAVCDKHYGDVISAHLCAGDGPPPITSLTELEVQLEITRQNAALAYNGQSTGLGLRNVTPLNPRAVLIKGAFDPHFSVLTFARGEPMVEMIANDPAADTLRLFVVKFHPACEATSCSFADLLTPTIETNWTGYELYDSDAFVNTPLDCNTCHQPDGPGTRTILRMQERLSPWRHWFAISGRADMFYRSHDLEAFYAGVSIDQATTDPDDLETIVNQHGDAPQPNEFPSQQIEDELNASGASATWQQLYANAVNGNAIPPPYFGFDQTDETKADAMSAKYRAVMAGTLPRDALPDIRDILADAALPAMSIRPKPGLDGRGILVHMCSQCHNSRLDQTLTRARFNVMKLDEMSTVERDQAIARLQLPDDDLHKMPPPRFRTLSSDEQALVITELSAAPNP